MKINGHEPYSISPQQIESLRSRWSQHHTDVEPFALRTTPLMHAPRLGKLFGLQNLFIKWEGANASGSQKDRISLAHLQAALDQGYRAVVAATCGNYGRSLSLLAVRYNIVPHIFLPSSYLRNRLESIVRFGGKVTFCQGSYEDAVEESNRFAATNGFWNASPGAHPEIEYLAYESIAQEILLQLGGAAPAIISAPASNGVTVAGLAQGFQKQMPCIVAGTTTGGNPILSAFHEQSPFCRNLTPQSLQETEINSPLVNWNALAGNDALKAIYKSKGTIHGVSDAALSGMADLLLRTEGICALPAATAGLCALLGYMENHIFDKTAPIVAVVTAGQN